MIEDYFGFLKKVAKKNQKLKLFLTICMKEKR